MDVRKVLQSSPSPADMWAWITLKNHAFWSGTWGTLRFRVKALLQGVEVRGPVKVYGRVDLSRYPHSRIVIGSDVDIVSSSRRASFSSIRAPTWIRTSSCNDAAIEIEDRVGLNGTSVLCRSTSVRIGSGTMVGPNVTIADTDLHALWPPDTRRGDPAIDQDRPVEIGRDVWLGAGCTVLKGVTIGDNAVIAAMTVVTRDVPANALAAGVPARVVRKLGGGLSERDPKNGEEEA